MEFRVRDYEEEEAIYSLWPRISTIGDHPLITRNLSSSIKVDVADSGKNDFYDPLRMPTAHIQDNTADDLPCDEDPYLSAKEWASFKRSLMQKFSGSKLVTISSISDAILRRGKVYEISSAATHAEELDNPRKASEDGVKVITCQEYVSRLREFQDEIKHAWKADDRVTSLKSSIKVARLLLDTSVSEFYPTLFILVTDVMDILGDMVWDRIKRKAEYVDDGTLICSLQENFGTSDVCSDAKETCYNWFCKIGSIRELLPRIYLELSILRCWRFLHEHPWKILHRVVMMIRGLADPLASYYCRLYMVYCAQKLLSPDTGYLVACITDMTIILRRIISEEETMSKRLVEHNVSLISLLEPPLEWIIKSICMEAYKKRQYEDIFVKLQLGRGLSNSSGTSECISIIIHHFLKELPAELVCSHASFILQLIESANDISLNQYLNYRLLGLKLSEQKSRVDNVDSVLGTVFQVITQYSRLDEYVKVVDAFLDIVLQYNMDNYLTIILDGISIRTRSKEITGNELSSLQSIIVKLLAHFNLVEDVLALNHFLEIIHVMHGSSRDVVNMHILDKGTRNGYICDPTTVQMLFDISQTLHDCPDTFSVKADHNEQQAHLISRFVQLVDYGAAMERHLTFLVECRGAFGRISELKEVLVRSSNKLAMKAIKDANNPVDFVKSCIAFNEVTIPSISATAKRMNLYLETVEVSLFSGLVCHADGLVYSAIDCLQSVDQSEGLLLQNDSNGVLSWIQKLCSLLVIIPGNPEQGVAYCPGTILALVESHSWITPQLRLRVFCTILSLLATLSQNKLPYHAYDAEVVGNDRLFYGDPSYHQELASLSSSVLTKVIDGVLQEPNRVIRGNLALEACNYVLSAYKATSEISTICSKLMEIAKSCLNANDKYMRNTVKYLDKHMSNTLGDATKPVVST
ncbi:hypothetical protein FRX31_007042 [Thalictrum thalictroides]|uniref:Uncharacterized protein n=1 Tax=Thalictrum thalictroides TaxID=46969 RepID=A0A7J6X0X3_THATH|nr:hypothetical protein FRX31_007042 [Thalictrum thalictroides]